VTAVAASRYAGVERLDTGVQVLGESPVWSARDGCLWWVDLRAPALHAFAPASPQARCWPLPALAGAVVLSAHGGVLVALERGIARFEPRGATLEPLLTVEAPVEGRRHNDSKADRAGRLWTSTMRDFGADASGTLWRVDADRSATRIIDGLRVPNALAVSPDDRVLYCAATRDGRVRAYPFDLSSGHLGAVHVLHEAGTLPGGPDGATVDADGCLWLARYGGGCVARITPAGAVDRVIELPVSQVTSCAFGGDDLGTLYVTSARQRLSAAELAAQPHAGAVFALRPGVRGLPEPMCTLMNQEIEP
jgi:sugar lactone lactonase YvrE